MKVIFVQNEIHFLGKNDSDDGYVKLVTDLERHVVVDGFLAASASLRAAVSRKLCK